MNLMPHWKAFSERRKRPTNRLKGLYKQKTTTGWPRSAAIDKSIDREMARIKAK
jgi:hypothetical protein